MLKELTNLTVTDLIREYKRSFREYWQDHDETVKAFRKKLIEGSLEAEREMIIGCKRYERSSERKDSCNGYWLRWIILKDGRLEIKMPRTRGGGYDSNIIPRYQQRIDEVDAALMKIFLYGGDLSRFMCLRVIFSVKDLNYVISFSFELRHRVSPFALI